MPPNNTSSRSQSIHTNHTPVPSNAFDKLNGTVSSFIFKSQAATRKFHPHAPNLDHDDDNMKSHMYNSHLIKTNTWISQVLNSHPNLLNYYHYAMQNHINHYINMPSTPPHTNSQQLSECSPHGSVSPSCFLKNQNFLRSQHSTKYNRSANSARSLDKHLQLYLSATYPEIMFITNLGGDVISVDGNGDAWDAFLDAGLIHPMFNILSPLAAYPLILGRNFLELIMCPKFQSILKFMLQVIASSENKSKLSYHWLSDSVDTERKMRLTLTRLTSIQLSVVRLQQQFQQNSIRTNMFYPFTSTQEQTPGSPNKDPENPNVLFCWTSKIMTETTRNNSTKSYYSHLAYPILPTIMPNSRGMCMLCKRLQVSKSDMSPTQWLEIIQAPSLCASISTKYPCMESDAKTPIFGKRGKLGVQLCDPKNIKTMPYLWLNGEQIVDLIRNRIAASSPSLNDNKTLSLSILAPVSSPSICSGSDTPSGTSQVSESNSELTSTTLSEIPNELVVSPSLSSYTELSSFSPCTGGSPGSQFDLGSHLALPVHSSLCEVCRLDLLQYFSPMYQPAAKDTNSCSSSSSYFPNSFSVIQHPRW